MANLRDMLMNARCRLITIDPWYGTMASRIKWIRDDRAVPTMGVRIVRGGEIECVFNAGFCNRVAEEDEGIEKLMAVVKHEIEHIVRLHIARIGRDREPKLWNIAADAVVNGKERSPRVEHLPIISKEVDEHGIPLIGEGAGPIYIPQDVDEGITTEEMFDYLTKNQVKIQIDCPMCGGTGKTGIAGGQGGQGDKDKDGQDKDKDGQGNGGCGERDCPMCGGEGNTTKGKMTVKGGWIDDHSTWRDSTVSKDEARQVVKGMVEEAISKAAGKTPGHIFEILKKLQAPIVNWKYIFRQLMGRKAGGRRTTYARRSRRHNHFGIKGKSSHASIPLTVMVDTSGSMSTKDLEMVFTEIESMSQRFKITLVQFDHEVQGLPAVYHRGDWRNIKINGRGGTSFTNVFDWIEEHKVVGIGNICLTDGYADFGPKRPYHMLFAIVNRDVVPPWGDHVIVTK